MASILAMARESDKSKRSFEFRMCKKVAELTQVVHMLFTRNHEKEVEMEALKEAYEFEICEVIADAKARIAKLRQQQEEMLKQQTGDADRIRRLVAGEFESKERDWQKKLEESERHRQEERAECQKLRDMLIHAQADIENLRRGVTDQVNSKTEEMDKRDQEIERLKKQVDHLEQTLKNKDKDNGDIIKELQRARENLEEELRQVQGHLDESHKTREQLLVRNKQLETELKALRRDLNRKVADMVNEKAHRNGSALSPSQNEELERLRREIQRYRLELSNRDVNFNRMFTDKQSIHLDRSGGTGCGVKLQTSHSAGTVHPSVNGTTSNHPGILKRDKTLSGSSTGPVICFQEQEPSPMLPSERQRAMSTPASHIDARDSRFPSICSSPDLKPRPHQDTKPRPHDTKPRPYESKTRTSNGNMLSKPRPLLKNMLFK